MALDDVIKGVLRKSGDFFNFTVWPLPGASRPAASVELADGSIVLFALADFILAGFTFLYATNGRMIFSASASSYPTSFLFVVLLCWLVIFLLRPRGASVPSQTRTFAAALQGIAPATFWSCFAALLGLWLIRWLVVNDSNIAVVWARAFLACSCAPLYYFGLVTSLNAIDYGDARRRRLVAGGIAAFLFLSTAAYLVLAYMRQT
jgi:hypothetical protein